MLLMHKAICCCLFIFSLSFASWGQQRISTSLSLTKVDFFHGFEYGQQHQAFEWNAGFEYGINRSIFQKRFFPKLKTNGFYNFIHKPKFNLGVGTQYAYSLYRFGATTKDIVQFHELMGGLRWNVGNQWRFGQTLMVGGLWENDFHTLVNKRQTYGTFGYLIQIDVSYAF